MADSQKQFVLALLGYCAQRNLDVQRLCELSFIDYQSLHKKKSTLTDEQINSLWRHASHLSDDTLFGLHFGESMQLAALSVVRQVVQASDTVRIALVRSFTLLHFITDMFKIKIEYEQEHFKIRITEDKQKVQEHHFTYRHMADFLMVFIMHELNALLRAKTPPISAHFPYTITDVPEFERIFQCPVASRATDLSLEFPNSLLDEPILLANYELQDYLLQHIGELIRTDEESIQAKVYNYIITNSYLYSHSFEQVAANFNLHFRSLQHKLRKESTTFLKIAEDVRKTLALNYLNAGVCSVKDIYHVLGYRDKGAFADAFKRWTNKTPGEYQKEIDRPQLNH